ncbi:hypothetical protein GCM10009715_28100 [Paeniglutamicibacter psychrophenolicus]
MVLQPFRAWGAAPGLRSRATRPQAGCACMHEVERFAGQMQRPRRATETMVASHAWVCAVGTFHGSPEVQYGAVASIGSGRLPWPPHAEAVALRVEEVGELNGSVVNERDGDTRAK